MSSSTSSTSSSSMISVSTAVLAVVAASAISHHYYTKKNNTATTTTSRDITDTDSSTTTTDRLKLWDDRWKTGRIAFHKTDVHTSLRTYCDDYLLDGIIGGGARILIPLCGKTIDMVYLTQKRPVSEVIGIDGIPKAIEEFIQEHPDLNIVVPETQDQVTTMTTTTTDITSIKKYKGDKISLYVGDFFTTSLQDIGNEPVDAIWDRGSLVAIEPSLREQYVQQIKQFIKKPSGKYLIATVVRSKTNVGPPYSIDNTEIQRLFGTQEWVDSIQLLHSHSMASSYYEMFMTYMRLGNIKEEIYLITTK
jgi:thiopurine S-methyltransferase